MLHSRNLQSEWEISLAGVSFSSQLHYFSNPISYKISKNSNKREILLYSRVLQSFLAFLP